MSRRRSWCLAAVAVLATVGYFWTPDTWVQTVYYDVLGYAGVVAMAVGLRMYRPANAAPWWLLLAGQFLDVSGDMVGAVMRRWLHLEPFPAPADYLYLAGYLVQAIGLLSLVRRRSRGRDGAALLEASIIGAAFALVSWVFLMKPVTVDSDLTLPGKLISVGYPALDLLLLALLVRLLSGARSRNVAFYWLAGHITLTLLGDYIWASTGPMNYTGGSLFSHSLDVVYLLSFLTAGVAALHPSMRTIVDDEVAAAGERLGPLKLALLAAATLIAPMLLLWQAGGRDGQIDATAIATGSVAMFLLVIARMGLLVRRVQNQSQTLERQSLALHALAQQDALTGLPNRRAWDEALPAALQHARRVHQPAAVAMLDLDHFKRYNDSFGHPAGDRLLASAATVWSAELRAGDLLARYGGEEFVVLLPGADEAAATALLNRLRVVTPRDQTFSAGVVVWDGEESHETLLERADQALYRAKAAGRDRVLGAADLLARSPAAG